MAGRIVRELTPQSERKLAAAIRRLERIVQEQGQQLTQQARFANPIPFLLGKADADIAADGSGTVSIWRLWNGTVEAAGYTETAYDWFGTGAVAGAKLQLWRHQQSGRLYFNMHLPLLGKTDAAVTQGGSGTVSVYTGTGGGETDTNSNVEAQSPFGAILINKWVWLSHNGHAWYMVAAECG